VDAASLLAAWTTVRQPIERSLPAFLSGQRWFGGKTRVIRSADIVDLLPIPLEEAPAAIVLARIAYADGVTETYSVPLVEQAGGGARVFADALWNRPFLVLLFEAVSRSRSFPGLVGELAGLPTGTLEALRRSAAAPLEPAVMKAEQSNTSILYGRSFVLKFFRHVEEGVNPDCEIGEFLSVRAGFRHVPPAAGSFEYRRPGALPATLGILQGYVANRGDAWRLTLGTLDGFYERAASRGPAVPVSEALPAGEPLGEFRDAARLLGRRTAELHLALASDPNDPNFAPEPFSLDYQREVSAAMIALARETFGMLRRQAEGLPTGVAKRARQVLAAEREILGRFGQLGQRPLGGLRMRIHGDLHLGQVLATKDDFIFLDFEGEPARTLAERRAKHSPLRDVAGMLRSFHYAAYAALFRRAGEAGAAAPSFAALAPLATAWTGAASAEFLGSYLETAAGAPFLPPQREEFGFFLALWLLDKAIYELKYELNHRVDWVAIPLEGICGLLDAGD
jgi:trehalose synthase-fused probable maltokinase